MNFKTLLLCLLVFVFSFNLFSLDSDIRFKYKDDFFYKLYLDGYSPEMIEGLEETFNDLDWKKLTETDRKKLEALRKKLKKVIKKRNKRKSIISSIFSSMNKTKKPDEEVIKSVLLSDKINGIDDKHEKTFNDLEWEKLTETDRKKLEDLRKKSKKVIKKRNKRESSISSIFSRVNKTKKSDEEVIKSVPLSDKINGIDDKHEKLLELMKKK